MKLSEKSKQAAFALLALCAAAVALYALLFSEPADKPSDLEGFVASVVSSPSIGLFMDARGASQATAKTLYQCGTDIAGGKLFGSHQVETYGCDDSGCLSTSSSGNGSTKLTYEQAKRKLRGLPYVAVMAGKPSTLFFERHIEIRLDNSFNGTCRIG